MIRLALAVLRDVARRWPLTTYFSLAFLLTWALLPFAPASVAVSFLALFGPAAAAVITAALVGGQALRELGSRVARWRVPARWYVVALLSPLVISVIAAALESVWGAPGPIQPLPISALGLVVFVLVIGEEIGWRGFALPRLLQRHGPWSASLILGALWALWHAPLFRLPGMPQYGSPFLPYIGYTIALSVILTFLARHTNGSVLISTLFHGVVTRAERRPRSTMIRMTPAPAPTRTNGASTLPRMEDMPCHSHGRWYAAGRSLCFGNHPSQ